MVAIMRCGLSDLTTIRFASDAPCHSPCPECNALTLVRACKPGHPRPQLPQPHQTSPHYPHPMHHRQTAYARRAYGNLYIYRTIYKNRTNADYSRFHARTGLQTAP